MAQRSSCQPASLYRFAGGLELGDYLEPLTKAVIKIDELVTIREVTCRVVAGILPSNSPAWSRHLRSLTGFDVALAGSSPFAVLVVPLPNWTYAISWGAGHRLLDDQLMDQGFGLAFAIRRLDPTRIGLVASSALDTTGRASQTSVPGGSDLGGFHLEPYGDQINRMSGAADLSGLTYHRDTGRNPLIRAGDGLSMPLPLDPEDLLIDLMRIDALVAAPDHDSALRAVFQIRPVASNDPHLAELNARLAAALGGDERFGPLGLAWPAPAVNAAEVALSFKVHGSGRRVPAVLAPGFGLEDLLFPFANFPPAARLARLTIAKVVPCADEDGENPIIRPIALSKWLVFETTIGFTRYCYNQGRWIKIGERFARQIRDQVTDLLQNRADVHFPLWTPTGQSDDEHRFCLAAAEQPGYLCLDKNFATTPFHPKLELCDLLGPNNELIHVKWLTEAAAASHLYTQALASAVSLRDEPEAGEQLDAKARAGDPSRAGLTPSAVVLAIAGRQWDIDRLFPLSQVTLLKLNSALRHQQMVLQFANIPYVKKTKTRRANRAA